jgi:hypothetical protein
MSAAPRLFGILDENAPEQGKALRSDVGHASACLASETPLSLAFPSCARQQTDSVSIEDDEASGNL